VRQDAACHDPCVPAEVRTHRRVAALGHGPIGDIGVCADLVVRLDVAEDQRAVALEAGADVDFRRSPADGLERLLQRQDEADRPPGRERHERKQRLVLRVLLPAERATRIGGVDANLGERQLEQLGDDALEPVRVLDRAPDRDPVAVRRGHERVWLDRELGDHRELVGALDQDDVRLGGSHIDIAPAVAMLVEDVAVGVRVVGPQRRVLDEVRLGGEGAREAKRRGQLLILDLDASSRLLRGVLGIRGDGRDGVAVVLRLPRRDHGPVATLGSEARHRVGEVSGRHHEPDARDRAGRGVVDAPDAGPRDGQRDELHVEDVLDRDVGDVRLSAGDAIEPADAWRPRPDDLAHCGATRASGVDATSTAAAGGWWMGAASRPRDAASSTASMICS